MEARPGSLQRRPQFPVSGGFIERIDPGAYIRGHDTRSDDACGPANTVLANDHTIFYNQSKSEIDQLGDCTERNNMLFLIRGALGDLIICNILLAKLGPSPQLEES